MEKSKKQKGRSFRKTRKQEGAGGRFSSLPGSRAQPIPSKWTSSKDLFGEEMQNLFISILSVSNVGLYNIFMEDTGFLTEHNNDEKIRFKNLENIVRKIYKRIHTSVRIDSKLNLQKKRAKEALSLYLGYLITVKYRLFYYIKDAHYVIAFMNDTATPVLIKEEIFNADTYQADFLRINELSPTARIMELFKENESLSNTLTDLVYGLPLKNRSGLSHYLHSDNTQNLIDKTFLYLFKKHDQALKDINYLIPKLLQSTIQSGENSVNLDKYFVYNSSRSVTPSIARTTSGVNQSL